MITFDTKACRDLGKKILSGDTKEWKKLLEEWDKHDEVYLSILDSGFFFFWIPIDRKTYKDIMELSTQADYLRVHIIEDLMCKKCILYPTVDMDVFPAGLPSRITGEIMQKSLFPRDPRDG